MPALSLPPIRRWRARVTLAGSALILLSACSTTGPSADTSRSPSPSAPPLQAVVVSSVSSSGPCGGVACAVAGANQRIGIFITDPNGGVVSGATVSAQVFSAPTSPGGQEQALGPEQALTYHGGGIENADPQVNRGVYSLIQSFGQPGVYHIRVKAVKGSVSATSDASLQVLGTDPGIAVGAAAPRSQNPIASQVSDISQIDTGTPPDDMHYTSIATAIAAKHPLVIYMGTPGFCQSRTCAPEENAVKIVESSYRPKGVDFVHVETYQGGRPDNANVSKATLSTTFLEWKLDTEPWVMVVDRSGNVVAKFSGATGSDEIASAVDHIL
jgi:hypothetical protein